MFCRNCQGRIEDIDFSADRTFATCPGCGALMSAEAAGRRLRREPPLPAAGAAAGGIRARRGSIGPPGCAGGGVPGRASPPIAHGARLRRLFRRLSFGGAAPSSSGVSRHSSCWSFGGVLYQMVCELVNHSVLEVGGGRIPVEHAPLPYRPGRSLDATQVEQIFCDMETARPLAATEASQVSGPGGPHRTLRAPSTSSPACPTRRWRSCSSRSSSGRCASKTARSPASFRGRSKGPQRAFRGFAPAPGVAPPGLWRN